MARWSVFLVIVVNGIFAAGVAAAQTIEPEPTKPEPSAGGSPAQNGAPPQATPPPGVYAPNWVPAPPPPPEHPRRVFSLTISPLHLVLPVVELTGEARAHDKIGVALIGGGGRYTDPNVAGISARVWEAGGQVRVYVIGDFRHGMQLGGELLYLHLDDPHLTATGEGLAIGPFVGYKIMTDVGFTFDAQVGFEYITARAQASGSTNNDKSIIPLLNLNVGWSF